MKYTYLLKVLTTCVFLGIIIFSFGQVIYQNRGEYISKNYWQRYPHLKQNYLDSQYTNKHPKGWIPDEDALSYAGGALITGINPTYVIADTPPLGKYLIGLSADIFDNENIITLICALVSLYLLFLIGKQVLGSSLLALIPVVLVSNEPILKNQLIYTPLLDIIQLVFLLASFYFFNKGLSKKIYLFFTLASIFLGCFISTKFFATGITVILTWIVVILFSRRFQLVKPLLITLPLSVFVLIASYFKLFLLHYSLKDILGVQKWIFLYHKSQLILPFSIWPLLLFNKWYVWFGNSPVISDSQWFFTWPILTIGTILTLVCYVFGFIERSILGSVLIFWSVLYLLFFSVGEISSRYLVILIPVMYIVVVYGVVSLIKKYVYKKK